MIKRAAVWFIEVLSEVLLLALVLTLLLGHDRHAFLKELLIYSAGVTLLFFTTGYLFTTLLLRLFWKGRTLWSCPAIAVVLFLIHFEIMNVGLGGAFEPPTRLLVRVVGTCIAFTCTMTGSFILRNWVPITSKSAETLP
jgi:hypothetical protein